ncbi:MAG: hypothetical protein LBI68_05350 [Azoarcus sp.]|nr:hypothetical protein [Azoarcus sp.]
MGKENLHIIAPEYYFNEHTHFPETHHIRQAWLQKQFYHPYPTKAEIDSFSKSIYPEKLLTKIKQYSPSNAILYNLLQINVYPELLDWIIGEIEKIGKIDKIEAILAWRDCASLSQAAKKKGIKIIYNELGPFRNPLQHETFYWDYEGVKNSTELAKRFDLSRNNNYLRKQCEKWAMRFMPGLLLQMDRPGCAVLMACEEDFAFMQGFSNYRLLAYAKERFPNERIVIRQHPLSRNVHYRDTEYDESSDINTLAKKCGHAITAYSNAAIELLSHGVRVDFMGDTPLRFLSNENMRDNERAWKAGFFCMNYLVPGKFMFNPEYYRWRLTDPSEEAIFERHKDAWEKLANPNNAVPPKVIKVFGLMGRHSASSERAGKNYLELPSQKVF